jgi:hypothetical protein
LRAFRERARTLQSDLNHPLIRTLERSRYLLRGVLFIVTLALFASAGLADIEERIPAKEILTADFSNVMPHTFSSLDGTNTRQSVYEGSLSFLQRHAIHGGPWYWDWGIKSDLYSFDNQGHYPINHLQDYAAQATLEYIVNGDAVAYMTIDPGFYFENDPVLSSWDVPFELASGIPISHSISGVLGLSYARFEYLPTPIAGLSWTASPRLRFDLVYPNPACILQLQKDLEAKIAGELIGGGFRTPDIEGRTHVQYFEYRVGAQLAKELKPGIKLVGGAGYVVDRAFYFLPHPIRNHAAGAPYVHLGIELSRW